MFIFATRVYYYKEVDMKILFMGTPDFALTILESVATKHTISLVVTQPDRVNGRGGKITMPPVKTWALEHDVPVFQPEKIKTEESVSYLKDFSEKIGGFDVAVVAAYGQILPEALLYLPKFHSINVHASLLPKYRGAAPIQWAILNGDKYTGVTTMLMGPGLDDGDILLQKRVTIFDDETGESLFDKLAFVGGELILETLDKIEKNEITPVKQYEADATHVSMIKKSMGRLDFSKTAEVLERYVRGLYSWPGAFFVYQNSNVKIIKASVMDSPASSEYQEAEEGTLFCDGKDLLYIKTSDKALKIERLQVPGKKVMDTADFLRGHKVDSAIKL